MPKQILINGTVYHLVKAVGLPTIEQQEEAEKYGHEVITVDAKWEEYGDSAGPRRNKEMIEMNPDWVIAFHEHIELSKGTKHTLSLAEKSNIPWVLCNKNGVIECSDAMEISATSDTAVKQRKLSSLLFKEKPKQYIS